jgi:hypothetical protein
MLIGEKLAEEVAVKVTGGSFLFLSLRLLHHAIAVTMNVLRLLRHVGSYIFVYSTLGIDKIRLPFLITT